VQNEHELEARWLMRKGPSLRSTPPGVEAEEAACASIVGQWEGAVLQMSGDKEGRASELDEMIEVFCEGGRDERRRRRDVLEANCDFAPPVCSLRRSNLAPSQAPRRDQIGAAAEQFIEN
jgi:hypothetical protein